MSERDPDQPVDPSSGDEPTTRVPSADDREDTTAFGPFTFRADEEPAPATTTPGPRAGRGRAGAVSLLVAALVLGTAGGVAGAAGYDALTDDGPGTSTTSQTATDTDAGVTRSPSERVTTEQEESGDAAALDGSVKAVAQEVLPSVVRINVAGSQGQGSGSGVILSEDGEILTNAHVVEVAEDGGEISVDFEDNFSAPAEIVGIDPVTDLAVIRAQGVDGLSPAELGDSDALGVGDGVVAIGSPFGLTATVTSGIVSALNRPVSVGSSGSDSTTYPAIQTDAAINPGNSGGPLVNMAGQVVGINSSIRSSSSALGGEAGSIGLGFAIPISKVLPIVDQLRNGETATHARLGVTVSQPQEGDTEDLRPGAGIEVVEEGSSAEEAGLEPGDLVTRVDDEVIVGVESLVATIRGYRPGDEVTLGVVRDGEELELEATLDSDEDATDQ
jgi:putative serine protease PepD